MHSHKLLVISDMFRLYRFMFLVTSRVEYAISAGYCRASTYSIGLFRGDLKFVI